MGLQYCYLKVKTDQEIAEAVFLSMDQKSGPQKSGSMQMSLPLKVSTDNNRSIFFSDRSARAKFR
jgi:hypothetical protein